MVSWNDYLALDCWLEILRESLNNYFPASPETGCGVGLHSGQQADLQTWIVQRHVAVRLRRCAGQYCRADTPSTRERSRHKGGLIQTEHASSRQDCYAVDLQSLKEHESCTLLCGHGHALPVYNAKVVYICVYMSRHTCTVPPNNGPNTCTYCTGVYLVQ